MQRVCIVRLSALGDCLHVLPIIQTLQENLGFQVSWVINKSLYPLFSSLKNVSFIPITKPSSILDYAQFYKTMKPHTFDYVLCLQSNLRANLLYPFISAKKKLGYKKLRAREGHRLFISDSVKRDDEHLLDHYFCFLESLGINERVRPTLTIDAISYKKSFDLFHDKPFVLIHPCASKCVRNWSVKNMQRLVCFLNKQGQQVLITGTANQWEYCQNLCQGLKDVYNLSGKTEISTLAALIKRAKLVIAPDTGPLHMADILGTKLLGLYAASNPLASGPYYQRQSVINKYPQALRQYFAKRPNPAANFKVDVKGVMDLIPYKQVESAVLKLLEGEKLQKSFY